MARPNTDIRPAQALLGGNNTARMSVARDTLGTF